MRLLPGVLAVSVLLALAGSAAGSPADKPAPAPQAPRPVKGDRDGDKVSEELEQRLASALAGETIRVIGTLTAGPTSPRIAALRAAVGDFPVHRTLASVDAFAATLTRGQVRALAARGDVVLVEEDSEIRALNDTAQSSSGVTKARLDAPSLDGNGDGSPGYSSGDLVAAVVDTGIDAGHRDLDGGKVIAFRDLVAGRVLPYDDHGHGTHVAAIAAGDGEARGDRLLRGVALGAALVGVKVLDAEGSGHESTVVAGVEWVVANRHTYGIEVVNLSLGGSFCSNGDDALSRAVDAAVSAGLVATVSAGNSGPDTCSVSTPGAARDALTVGAMADTGEGGFSLASFSSRGPTLDGRAKPDVVAPGVAVASADANTFSGYVEHSGTSMSAPFTAGVALLMLDANRSLSPTAVKDLIRSTAVDWGPAGVDIDYGAGRVDAYAAVRAAGAALSSPPSSPVHRVESGSLAGTGAVFDAFLPVADLGNPIAATLILPELSSRYYDFDMSLFDPAGRLLASSVGVDRQETINYQPVEPGTYRVRVFSFSGSGPYVLDLSYGLIAPPPPPPPPSFELASFFAYAPAFTGGVLVAGGDVDGDGRGDIVTGVGAGGGPHVRVFSGGSGGELASFFAYAAEFRGGVQVAAGDVNRDGRADVVTGVGAGGGPHVKVFDGRTRAELASFFAYSPAFTGGVQVAAGDVNGDGFADIVTGVGAGGGPHVRVFDGRTGGELASFFAYSAEFRGGVQVAAGDVSGDGFADVVTGVGAGGGPHVKVFDGRTGAEIASFFAYAPGFTGGVQVAAGDVNGDGRADIVTGTGSGGGPHVRVFDGRTGAELASFFAYDAAFTGGVRVGSADLNRDGRSDLLTGAGPGASPHVKAFNGASLP